MKYLLKNILLAILIYGSVLAGDAGRETPFSIGVGARALGMGGGFTSLANDASAIYYNPAGLSRLQIQEFSLMHTTLLENTIYDYAGWVYPDMKLGGVGLGFMRIGTNDIIKRNNFVEEGKFDYSYTQFLLSYGRKLEGGFSLGLSFKVVNQSLDNLSAYGLGLDFGMMVQIHKYLTSGIIIRDMVPPEIKLKNLTEITPITVAGGVALTNFPLARNTDLTMSFELEKIENRSTKVHAGTELLIEKMFALRVGYDRDNLALGTGFKFHRLKIDYAYKILDYIDNSHRISLTFLIGSSLSEQQKKKALLEKKRGTYLLEGERLKQFNFYRQKADMFYKQYQLDSAITFYQRALAFDENNQEIIGKLAALENVLKIQREEQRKIKTRQAELQKEIQHYLTQANHFFAKNYYQSALDMLQLIFDIEPNYREAVQLKQKIEEAISKEIIFELESAKKSEDKGDYLHALEAYNRVLELDPNNQIAKVNRKKMTSHLDVAQQLNKGIELFNSGKFDKAKISFNTVLSIEKSNKVALEYLKKINLAASEPMTLDELQNDKVVWQYYLDGLRYMRNKEYKKAIDSWEKVLKVYPNNINTLNNIEQARLRLKAEQQK
ncbi:MAG: PorV/PorQ family protein [FCB group bacterium]|nr:PorV/PorQ family protein [FCB group bacterium]